MSYTIVGPGGPRQRPGVVVAASLLLYVAAVFILGYGVLGVVQGFLIKDLPGFAGPDAPPELARATSIGVIVGNALSLLPAIGFVVLGVLVDRGSQPARIVTWVVCGVVALCCGCGLLGDAVSTTLLQDLSQPPAAVADIEAAIPDWMAVLSLVTALLTVGAAAFVVVLLALPAANDYFRKDQEIWQPSTGSNDEPGGATPFPPGPVR